MERDPGGMFCVKMKPFGPPKKVLSILLKGYLGQHFITRAQCSKTRVLSLPVCHQGADRSVAGSVHGSRLTVCKQSGQQMGMMSIA